MGASFYAYHRILRSWMKVTGQRLGAIDARLVAPLHAAWDPSRPGPWLLPALLVLGAFVAFSGRLFLRRTLSPTLLLAVSSGCFVTIGLSVSMIDGFRESQDRRVPAFLVPYTKAHLEYFGDVPEVDRLGVRTFLARYAKPRFFDRLSLHPKTHPPGGVVFQWLVSQLFGHSLWAAALASIAFAALTVPLVYLLGRELYGEAVARAAVALFLVTPNFVMFTTTSMDGPFAVFPVLSFYLVLRALRTEAFSAARAVLSGLALAAGSLMTYGMVCMAALFGLQLLLVRWWPVPIRATRTLAVLAVAALTALAVYGLLILSTGYDPVAGVRASLAYAEKLMGGTGRETFARYLNLSTANLITFLIGVGVAITVLAIRETGSAVGALLRGVGADGFVLTVFGSLLAMAFSSLFTMEVERVWLFMVPFVVVAVARRFRHAAEDRASRAIFYWAIGVCCVQLVVFEAALGTAW